MRLICAVLGIALSLTALADYRNHPRAAEFRQTLIADGFPESHLDALLAAASRNPRLVEAEQKSAEKTKTWPEYLGIFLREDRISAGVQFWQTHAATLESAERQYGVPAEYLVAIIGVETRYGGYTGPHRVLDSLATQGFDHPTRSGFFFNELVEFVRACRDFNMDPFTVQGSYAGAMGLSQFMPSNYRRLAVDFDGDGSINLWTVADAIGSTANYLTRYRGPGKGWQPGMPAVVSAQGLPTDSMERNPTRPETRYADFVPTLTAIPAIPAFAEAGLLELHTDNGPQYWFGLTNFYNLMAYNPRVYYAMAVYRLARAIADTYAAEVGTPG